jgi:hypothetical protein
LMRAVVLAETLAVAVHAALIGCAPGGGAPWAVGVVVRRISRSVVAVGCSARSVACSARSVAAVGCSSWLVAVVGCGARSVAVVVVRTKLVAVRHGRQVRTGRQEWRQRAPVARCAWIATAGETPEPCGIPRCPGAKGRVTELGSWVAAVLWIVVVVVPLPVVMGVPVVLRVLLALRLSRGVTIPCEQRSITSIRRLCTVRSNVCVRALGLHIVGGVPALLRVVGL